MKMHYILMSFILCTCTMQAQTPNTKEWLRQKRTQRQYFAEQLAHLQVYKEAIQKGYEIANKGLSLIGDHERQTFNLNDNYLTSLTTVKPEIIQTQNPDNIISTQVFIIKSLQQLVKECNESESFSQQERRYIETVCSTVRTKCTQTTVQLQIISSDSTTTMTDMERMQRLDQLVLDMQEHKKFTMAFCASTRSLQAQRAKEKREAQINKKLNTIEP